MALVAPGIRIVPEGKPVVDTDQLLELLRRFAATMSNSFDVNDMLYQLGDTAVAVVGADAAGVSLAAEQGHLRFVTATDRSLIELEMVQESEQDGPCVEAFRRNEPILVSNIAAEPRWERYREAARHSHYAAVIGMPLVVADHRLGSLNLYQRRTRLWSPEVVDAARTLADIATAYVVRAGELAELRTVADQLQRALDSRIVIEQAKGVISTRHEISIGEAFDALRNHARRQRRPLREVAADVVAGALDVG
jgi:GAF domain-containing protein